MRKPIIRGLTVRIFCLNDAYESKELMRHLITLTPQWQISREIEMTQILFLYSESTRRRKEAFLKPS